MDNKKPKRPFQLEYEDANKEIVNAIINASQIHGVPFYLIVGIVENALHQCKENANKELAITMKKYDKEMAEYIEAEKAREQNGS